MLFDGIHIPRAQGSFFPREIGILRVFCRDKNPVVLPVVREPKPGFFFPSGIRIPLKTEAGISVAGKSFGIRAAIRDLRS